LTKFRFRGISNSYKKQPSASVNSANQFKSYICLFSTCGLQMIISFVVVSTSGKAIFNF